MSTPFYCGNPKSCYSPERQNSEKRNLSSSRSFGILDRIPKRKGSRDLLSGTGQLYSEIQLYFAG